ncbi:polyphenol oxidase, partial [Halomonas sp. ND22Bw]|uniref:laccase domain-containing protein n=1 Tax=Halomonas sp. ND22Bw TaxID=2054178 RepID=UPI000D2CEC02
GGVVHSAVSAMQALGAEPRRILAVVGPCIAPASYEVGADFEERFVHHDPGSDRFFHPGEIDDKRQFDLPGFVAITLGMGAVLFSLSRVDTLADLGQA